MYLSSLIIGQLELTTLLIKIAYFGQAIVTGIRLRSSSFPIQKLFKVCILGLLLLIYYLRLEVII